MTTHVQRIKFNPEAGQFLLRVDSLITSVVKSVAAELRNEYKGEATFQHLVWLESHPEYSVLVVTPATASQSQQLLNRTTISAKLHLREALRGRMVSRAS